MLEKAGHSVTMAIDGREAVSVLESTNVDLVLMDVQMPVMDGFEAARLIRQRDETSGVHTPIIAVTAHAMEGDRERCLRAGMDGYISKPIDSAELYRAIHEVGAAPMASEGCTALDLQPRN